jgi:hypothetical protein
MKFLPLARYAYIPVSNLSSSPSLIRPTPQSTMRRIFITPQLVIYHQPPSTHQTPVIAEMILTTHMLAHEAHEALALNTCL